MEESSLYMLINRLIKLPKECEWVEFKLNIKTPEEIGD